MLRSACRPGQAHACIAIAPRILAIGLGILVTGCSASVDRFDSPMFGLTESGKRASAPPIPREGLLSDRGSSSYDTASYSSGYGSSYSGGSYQAGPAQPSYNPPPSRPDQRQPRAPRPQYADYYDQQPSYQAQPQRTEMAALPEPATTDSYRPLPPKAEPARVDFSPVRTVVPAAKSRPANPNAREVVVEPGDTLNSIAQAHGASISELMTLNGLRSPIVQPGQRIALPARASAMAASVRRVPPAKTKVPAPVVVAESAPALEWHKEQPAVVAAAEPAEPRPALKVPAPQPVARSGGDTYTIRQGENLYGIAVRHGVPLAELLRVNNISDPRKVRAGTTLKIPAAGQAPTAVAAAPAPAPAPAPVAVRPAIEPRREAKPSPAEPKPTPAETQTAAATPAPSGDVLPAKPVIINARPERVAALETPGTVSDAAPALTAPQPATTESGEESASASPQEKSEGPGKFRWPVRGKVIAGFGNQPGGGHSDGIKLAVPAGTHVHAAEGGVVAYAGSELKDYGNLVLVRHDNGWITAYAHNAELNVKRGDRVRRGQVIAKAGNSGSADSPQLHFELRQGSSAVDPIPHLEKL